MGWFRRDKRKAYLLGLSKVSINLFEVGTMSRPDHAPLVLDVRQPGAKLRYMAFCLATTSYFALVGDDLEVFNAAFIQCWERLTELASSEHDGLFDGPIDKNSINEATGVLNSTVDDWRTYAETRSVNHGAGIPIKDDKDCLRLVCCMLRRVELPSVAAEEDLVRLEPLARWFQETVASVDSAFADIVG